MLTSVHFDALATDKAIKLIRNQLTSIDGEVAKKQKKLSQEGVSPDLLPPMLLKQREEAKKYMEDITSRNQKLFFTTLVVAIFGDNLEEIKNYEELVHSVATKYMCDFKKLFSQQEVGLASALPIGINKVLSDRLLTSETAALFIPFSSQEISHKRGFYYGVNPLSRNLILFDRTSAKNANGVILGMSGTGKSFGCKREMLNVLLNTDDVVYVIDPDREYPTNSEFIATIADYINMQIENEENE
jgi:type IV secretory pathway VirB4 component